MNDVRVRFVERHGMLTVLEVDTPDSHHLPEDVRRVLAAADVLVLLAERRRVGGRLQQRLRVVSRGGAELDRIQKGELRWRILRVLEPPLRRATEVIKLAG